MFLYTDAVTYTEPRLYVLSIIPMTLPFFSIETHSFYVAYLTIAIQHDTWQAVTVHKNTPDEIIRADKFHHQLDFVGEGSAATMPICGFLRSAGCQLLISLSWLYTSCGRFDFSISPTRSMVAAGVLPNGSALLLFFVLPCGALATVNLMLADVFIHGATADAIPVDRQPSHMTFVGVVSGERGVIPVDDNQ